MQSFDIFGPAPARLGRLTAGFFILAALTVTGCSKSHRPAPEAPAPAVAPPVSPLVRPIVPIPSITPRQQTLNAIDLLNKGDVTAARIQILGVLAQRPNDRAALDFLAQIDTDPRKLLGERSYTYQIRSGETLASIAGRLLGNPRRFWALARYNGIAVPANAEVGRAIQIPGAPRAARVVRPAPPPVAAAPPATVEPKRIVANPAAASRLRAAGLAEMTRGSIDKAVGLLQRALALNPTDTAIQEDLTRARAIQQTVRKQ